MVSEINKISHASMQIIDRVLGMKGGYVLDFDNRGFEDFIARQAGIDATAKRYSVAGGSKAKRLRAILDEISPSQRGQLLRALLKYRDDPVRASAMELLDESWRRAYEILTQGYEKQTLDTDQSYASSSWTGRRTVREQIAIIRSFAPVALHEIAVLADVVEERRFNDPITASAVQCLRELHEQLGNLLESVDRGQMSRNAVEAFEENRKSLLRYMKEGAKLTMVAPAMTLGIVHLLALMTGVPIDSTMVSTVFASLVASDALSYINKETGIS